jgi:hypothetical protein
VCGTRETSSTWLWLCWHLAHSLLMTKFLLRNGITCEESFISRFQIPKMRCNWDDERNQQLLVEMGASSSKDQSVTPTVQTKSDRPKEKKVVCEHCVKSMKQVDRPPELDSTALCNEDYARVDACMKSHKGQVSACAAEWKAFQQCHIHQRSKTSSSAAAAVAGS